jgi:hypothetical protein
MYPFSTRSTLLLGAGLAALLSAPSTAFAQDQAPAETAEEPNSNDIIVTARRRSESAQDIPLAVSVIDARQLDETGAFNVNRLQQLAPTLQFYSSNPRNTAVNIRGLGVPFGLTSDGFEQGVGIYVDDVYYSRVASATFDFLDVAQIEVLRGPQGTLYGKNTTAGAINITTNQPSFDFEGRAEISLGNYEFRQARLAVSGPLSENVAARVAFSGTSRRGTIRNVVTGQDIQSLDNLGVRAQVLWEAADNLKITLVGDYNKQDANCCGSVFVRTGTTQRPLNRQFAALAAAQNYAPPGTNPFDRLTDLDSQLNAGNVIAGASLRAVWDIGPGTFTSVTAWRYWDWKPENDRDFTGLPIVSLSQNPSQQNQYTQEFRYAYTGDKFDFVLGAFAFDQRIDTQGTEAQGLAASRWNIAPNNALSNDPSVLNGLTARNTQFLESTSLALFGQVSWKVTDAFTIQPGARVNYDKKKGFYQRRVFTGTGTELLGAETDARSRAQLGVFQPQVRARGYRLEPYLRPDAQLRTRARCAGLRHLCQELQDHRDQPERVADRRQWPADCGGGHDPARNSRSLRAWSEKPVLGSQGDTEPRRFSHRDQRLSGDCEQRPIRGAARVPRQCGQGALAGGRGRFLHPPQPAFHRLCQRRLHRRQIRRLHRCTVPARIVRRHHRCCRPDPVRTEHPRRDQSGQLRHLRAAPTRRIEVGVLFRGGGQSADRVPRQTGRSLSRL